MQTKMTQKHKLMAYVLNVEFGYTMTAIAKLMGVAQSTISTAIKDVNYMRTISNLENALCEARSLLIEQGIEPPPAPKLFLE